MESAAEPRLQTVPTDALQCPICVEIPQGEIYQCVNGHSFCVTCSTKLLDKCPVCKIKLAGKNKRIRNRFMEELIGSTTIPCKYNQDGCDKVISRKEAVAHFESCEFRPFQLCQKLPSPLFRKCAYGNWNASEIFSHFIQEHWKEDPLTTPEVVLETKDAVDFLKATKMGAGACYHLFQLKSSKGQVANFLLWIIFAFPGDSTFMCLYMGEKVTDVSPFLLKLKVKAANKEEQLVWKGRPTHYKKVDDVVKSPPLKLCLEVMIGNGDYPELQVRFYEKETPIN